MSAPRQMPRLGQPGKTGESASRREPSLPTHCAPVAARGPKLGAALREHANR
jgi:hypothetical protein